MNYKLCFLRISFALILIILGNQLIAQEQDDKPSKLKYRLDFFHQDNLININAGALGIYDKVYIRPGAAISAEYAWYENRRIRLFSSVKTSFHFNIYEERTASLGSETGLDIMLFKGLFISPKLGIHGAYVVPTDVRYVYDGDEWVEADRSGEGFARFLVTAGVDLGYRIRKGQKPIDIIANSTGLIGSPYVPDTSLAIWVWASAGIGLRMGF